MQRNKKKEVEASTELFNAILSLDNLTEAKKFFKDLFSKKEILEFSRRWKLVRMLNDKVTYKQIEAETGLSPRTIARGSLWMKKGYGGWQMMLKKTRQTK